MPIDIQSDILDLDGASKLALTGDVNIFSNVTRIIVGVLECAQGTKLHVRSPFLLIRAGAIRGTDWEITWHPPANQSQAPAASGGNGGNGADGSNAMGATREGGDGQAGTPGVRGGNGVSGSQAPSVVLAYSRKWTLYPEANWVNLPLPVVPPAVPAHPPAVPQPSDPLLTALNWFEEHSSAGRVTISLAGQNGNDAQDAGRGGDGGNGGRGATAVYRSSSEGASPWGATGGAAGRGGHGGLGGFGGSGGVGGGIFILAESAENGSTAHVGELGMLIHHIGGAPGFPGSGSDGGKAGIPGLGGAADSGMGDRTVEATGKLALDGEDGQAGESGIAGPPGFQLLRRYAFRTKRFVPQDGLPFGPQPNGYLRDVHATEFLTFGI